MTGPEEGRRRVDRVPDDIDASDVEARYHDDQAEDEDEDDDHLDGMCDLDFEMAPRTDDSEIPALVLFAATDFLDPAAVEARRAEWLALFPQEETG